MQVCIARLCHIGHSFLKFSVLVIRRKDHGLTDIVSNEGRRPELLGYSFW